MSKLDINYLGVAMNILDGKPLTEESLSKVLDLLTKLDESLTKEDLDQIKKQLEHTIGLKMTSGEVIHSDDHKPWVEDEKAKIQWDYWNSYKQYLSADGWSKAVITILDEDTDKILTECGNPLLPEGWKFKGLVMGDVQSGKTANYNGLIAKAADSGYKVIVLLTGLIEELRKQTQERMDFGFVGRNSRDVVGVAQNMQPVGAGKYRKKFANVLTSVDDDFLTSNSRALRGMPLSNISEPVLFVIKKNVAPLENLKEWLFNQIPNGATQHQIPILIVDDEADNASVNTKKTDDAPINKLIRGLLDNFARSTYVAFTATPFANVFIDPSKENDLFPSNFIYSLNSPSNYIGADSIFPDESEYRSQLKEITDIEPLIPVTHKKTHDLHDIPDSMKMAVKVFMLSCALRDIRKEKLKHRSMLVNVSRFTDVQGKIAEHLRQYLNDIHEEIRQYLLSSSWASHSKLLDLKEIFQEEFGYTKIEWDEVRGELYKSTASIKVVTINLKSVEKLNYSAYKETEKGRRVIAVGGLSLSRGLTLEGLSVSYFYRNSKAYDTLLQMGRWFGYRTGYDDLFRVWMDIDAIGWYAHITNAVSELRTDFRRMSANRMTPDKFGIRVLSHPDTLMVTALNKMRTSTEIIHRISFSAYSAETTIFYKSLALNTQNIQVASSFVDQLGSPEINGVKSGKIYWPKVDKRKIYEFLSKLNISDMNMQFIFDQKSKARPLINFIDENKIDELSSWGVCISQGQGPEVSSVLNNISGKYVPTVLLRQRKFDAPPKNVDYLKINKQKVGDTSDELVGMSEAQKASAKAEWQKEGLKDPKKNGKAIPAYIYRLFRERPLLTISFVGISSIGENSNGLMNPDDIESKVMVAVGLSFPNFDKSGTKSQLNNTVAYRLNKVAIEELYGTTDEEDDED
jgi:hypothetical protein